MAFSEGERVLCYEPDPSMARVIYNAKILKVVSHKEAAAAIATGKKRAAVAVAPAANAKEKQYLVHFQGWSSSWDRYKLFSRC